MNMREKFMTIEQDLNLTHPAMRLYEKAKRLGVWNPSDFDYAEDRRDWQALRDTERDLILRLMVLFQELLSSRFMTGRV